MRERMTDPPETELGNDHAEGRRGNTTMAQGENQHPVPRMPHERDESVDSQSQHDPSQQRVARKGRADAERGVADTTKGAELDATYDKLREGEPDGEKKFRP